MTPTLRRLAALALGALTLASCGVESPTLPQLQQSPPEAPSSSLLGGLTSLIGINGLQRTTPLAAPITVTKAIGPEGGTLAIPQAGVTVTVPRGALTATTTITMTARAGSLVAYDFAPHGVVFARPLVFSQQPSQKVRFAVTQPELGCHFAGDEGR